MELIRGLHEATPPSAVTIGNFDGLHLGHQALLERLDAVARPEGLHRVVLTFEPLPREVFVRHILVKQLNARHVLIGDDFRFGHRRGGDFALLQRMGAEEGFTVEATPQVMLEGARVSSTRIRTALTEGQLTDAARLLGRPYSLCARVTHGDKRGRQIGFPTLNLPLGRKHFALHGVYAVEIIGLADHPLPGVANAGTRPTVGGVIPRVEAHIFDWSGNAYGKRVEVRFRAFIREERTFDGLDALVAQIAKDAASARALFDQSAI